MLELNLYGLVSKEIKTKEKIKIKLIKSKIYVTSAI